jgi:CDP-glycerol glycerophosphotransferase (TagB/SpsB family)
MKKINKVLQIIFSFNLVKVVRNFILYFFSLFIPKSKKFILIGSWFGSRFADNSKYLYLHINNNLQDLGFKKAIWISRDIEIVKELNGKGFCAYQFWSVQSIWYHFRSYFHVIDQSYKDINSIFSIRSKRIHLWHGFPLKRLGSIGRYTNNGLYDETIPFQSESRILTLRKKLNSHGFWSDFYLLGTSVFSAQIMSKTFNVKEKNMLISAYPRNFAPIFKPSLKFLLQNEKDAYQKIESLKNSGYKLFGYFPTFRDSTETLVLGSNDTNEILEFLDTCEINKVKIICKFHSAEKNTGDKLLDLHPALINLSANHDIYSYIDLIDIVITDYSTIGLDFLLWERPVIYYPYDLKYYSELDRKLTFDYKEFTPGPKVYTLSELKKIIIKPLDEITIEYNNKFGNHANQVKRKIFGEFETYDINHLIEEIKNK